MERLRSSLGERALILGVDRLDYTKGLPERFRGFAKLLRRFPQYRDRVTFLQVAPVSRGEIGRYRALRRELDELAGRINGENAEFDWTPLRYMTRAIPRATLAGFHRIARVGLVTPLRDGMNLVAKEFVAAQNADDPGALVLSRFAGAAEELDGALLVNPHDPDEIAEAVDAALSMPHAERLSRWRSMQERVQRARRMPGRLLSWLGWRNAPDGVSLACHGRERIGCTGSPTRIGSNAAMTEGGVHLQQEVVGVFAARDFHRDAVRDAALQQLRPGNA